MYKIKAIILGLALTFALSAQRFEGGLTAGILGSQIDGDFLGGYNKFGVTFGAWVSHDIGNNLEMIGELRYIQKGKSKPPVPEEGIYSETTRLNYIQLPLMLRYNLVTDWFIEGGLGLGYLFSYSFWESGTKLNEDSYPIEDEELKTGELCFLIGAGYYINQNFAINLRFTNDIFPIARLTDAVGTNPWIRPGSLYNKTLELGVVYAF